MTLRGGEGDDHRTLKEHIAAHPQLFKQFGTFGPGQVEFALPSGDEIDVLRGAIADPWVFSGQRVTADVAAGFLLEYYDYLVACAGEPKSPVQRVKQLLRYWTAGGVVRDEDDRLAWLREPEPLAVIARLRALVAAPDA